MVGSMGAGRSLNRQGPRRLIALGFTNGEIGDQLGLSVRTVETHRAHIMAKLDFDSRSQLVRYAIDNGLLP